MDNFFSETPVIIDAFVILLVCLYLPGTIFARFLGTPKNFHIISLAISPLIIYLGATIKMFFNMTGAGFAILVSSVMVVSFFFEISKRNSLVDHSVILTRSKYSKYLVTLLIILIFLWFNPFSAYPLFRGDALHSWNVWALMWSQGHFPSHTSAGYPQLAPIIWSLAYLTFGAEGQFIAYMLFKILMIMPLLLGGIILSQRSPRAALYSIFAYIILTLNTSNFAFLHGNPDWVAKGYLVASLLIVAPDIYMRRITSQDNWLIAISFLFTAILHKLVLIPWLLLIIVIGLFLALRQKKGLLDFSRLIAFSLVLVGVIFMQYSLVEYFRDFDNPTQFYTVQHSLHENAALVLSQGFNLLLPFLLGFTVSIFYLALFSVWTSCFSLLALFGIILWYTNLAYDIRHLVLFTNPICVLSLLFFCLKKDTRAQKHELKKIVSFSSVQLIMLPVLLSLWSLPVLGSKEALREEYDFFQMSDNNRYQANLKALDLIDKNCRIFNAAHHLNRITKVQEKLLLQNNEKDFNVLVKRLRDNESSDTRFTIFHARSDNFARNLKNISSNQGCTAFIFYPEEILGPFKPEVRELIQKLNSSEKGSLARINNINFLIINN